MNPAENQTEEARAGQILKAAFRPEELAELRKVDPWKSTWAIASNFVWIAAWMALAALYPNPLTIFVALFGIGARQLGFAVLMHDAAHRSLYANRELNDWAGNWLCGYPVWSEVGPYRRYHLIHHAHTGTKKDPDLALAAPFPTTRKSLLRKLFRDLRGETGWKQAVGTAKRDLGIGKKKTQRNQGLKAGEKPDVGWHKLVPFALWNAIIFAACWAVGYAWVYVLYPVAFLTTYRMVLRIRAIAEHAMVGAAEDPLQNTRTTLPSWWERIFIAPLGINYHMEHHFVMTIPWYNLKKMHQMLRDRGFLEGAMITDSYMEVLRTASSRTA